MGRNQDKRDSYSAKDFLALMEEYQGSLLLARSLIQYHLKTWWIPNPRLIFFTSMFAYKYQSAIGKQPPCAFYPTVILIKQLSRELTIEASIERIQQKDFDLGLVVPKHSHSKNTTDLTTLFKLTDEIHKNQLKYIEFKESIKRLPPSQLSTYAQILNDICPILIFICIIIFLHAFVSDLQDDLTEFYKNQENTYLSFEFIWCIFPSIFAFFNSAFATSEIYTYHKGVLNFFNRTPSETALKSLLQAINTPTAPSIFKPAKVQTSENAFVLILSLKNRKFLKDHIHHIARLLTELQCPVLTVQSKQNALHVTSFIEYTPAGIVKFQTHLAYIGKLNELITRLHKLNTSYQSGLSINAELLENLDCKIKISIPKAKFSLLVRLKALTTNLGITAELSDKHLKLTISRLHAQFNMDWQSLFLKAKQLKQEDTSTTDASINMSDSENESTDSEDDSTLAPRKKKIKTRPTLSAVVNRLWPFTAPAIQTRFTYTKEHETETVLFEPDSKPEYFQKITVKPGTVYYGYFPDKVDKLPSEQEDAFRRNFQKGFRPHGKGIRTDGEDKGRTFKIVASGDPRIWARPNQTVEASDNTRVFIFDHYTPKH